MNPIILADNRLLDGTPMATDTAGGYDVLNLGDLRTYTKWQAASPGSKYITVYCGAQDKAADAIGIVGHNLATAAAQVSVDSSADGVLWTNRLPACVPASDRAFLKLFPAAAARWWRVGIGTVSAAPAAAVLVLGSRILFPYPPDAPFRPAGEKMEAETQRSKAGHLLGSVVRFRPVRIRARFSHLPRTFVEETLVPWWETHAGHLFPFFWAWDLDRYPEAVHFVRLDEGYEFAPDVSTGERYDSFELELEGIKEL